MVDISAWVWHYALLGYGRGIPYHPGKWRVFERMWPKTAGAWRDPQIVQRDGIRYELDRRHFVDRHIYYLDYEALETGVLKKMVGPGCIAVDAGANIGYDTMTLARLVGPTGRVYAFEPATPTRQNLRRNLELNSFPNVEVSGLALSDVSGDIGLSWSRGAGLDNPRKAALTTSEAADEVVRSTTLDLFSTAQGLRQIDFIKVDVEGAECAFLRGAEAVLNRFQPLLLLELNPEALAAFGSTAAEVFGILEAHGYSARTLTWRGVKPLKAAPQRGSYCNILALPSRRDRDEV